MKSVRIASLGLLVALAAPQALAERYDVSVQNLTSGNWFTPLLVAAHAEEVSVFEPGEPASAALETVAEVGDISVLQSDLISAGADVVANPAGGLLGPGQSVHFTLESNGARPHTRVSLAAMILPTNDGFIALNGVRLPLGGRAATHYVPGHDAGTEGNSEIRDSSGGLDDPGFPVPPPLEATVGTGGSGISVGAEGIVTVHRGVLGDSDDAGGSSDIDSRVHRWKNPIARVTIQRQ